MSQIATPTRMKVAKEKPLLKINDERTQKPKPVVAI
jgi:hypothetical protein